MTTIYKYLLKPDQDCYQLPQGAEILSAGAQGDDLCVWAKVDPDKPLTNFFFEVFGTGHEMKPPKGGERKFLQTVFMGSLVWHVFQRFDMEY